MKSKACLLIQHIKNCLGSKYSRRMWKALQDYCKFSFLLHVTWCLIFAFEDLIVDAEKLGLLIHS